MMNCATAPAIRPNNAHNRILTTMTQPSECPTRCPRREVALCPRSTTGRVERLRASHAQDPPLPDPLAERRTDLPAPPLVRGSLRLVVNLGFGGALLDGVDHFLTLGL